MLLCDGIISKKFKVRLSEYFVHFERIRCVAVNRLSGSASNTMVRQKHFRRKKSDVPINRIVRHKR